MAGITMGLAMAALLGLVNLLVIRLALNCDIRAAIANGAAVVLADTLMSGVAAFALHALQHFPVDYTRPVQVIGGLMLAAWVCGPRELNLWQLSLPQRLSPRSWAPPFFSPAAIPEQHWDFWPCSRPWRKFCN